MKPSNRRPSALLPLLLLGTVLSASARAGEAVGKLLAAYDAVPQLSCELRRDVKPAGGDSVRFLSRIFFRRPDCLHAENLSPMKRRTVCDGRTLRQYTEGLPRGFSRPVAELEGEALTNLRMLPGSNANWLEPLKDFEETELPADGSAARRIACTAPGKAYAVLSFDGQGRWIRLEMFSGPDCANRLLLAEMSDFAEILPGTWLARRQTVELSMDGAVRSETVRLDNLSATAPIPEAMFDAESFFPGVTFTDSYEKMF
jgi:hypothetical protein